VASLAFSGCGHKEEEEPEAEPVVTVEAAPALSTSISLKVTAEAVLYPIQQASLVPKITAPVHAFYVEKGSHVRAGQLLAELESQDLASSVAENRAAVDQAEAAFQTTAGVALPEEIRKAELEVRGSKDLLDAQQKHYDSLQELFRQGAIAQKEVTDASVSLTEARNRLELAQHVLDDLQNVGKDQTIKSATAQREAARARLQSSQTQLGYAKIVSPIAGVVTDRPLFPGETASSGSPLVTVMDLSSVIAKAHLSPQDAEQIKIGNPANLLASDGGASIPGKVTQISPALDPSTTTVEVWVQAVNPQTRLRAGTSVRVEIIARTERIALVIPESAVITDESGEAFVMMIGEGDMPHKQAVMLGIHDAGNVQVTEGLKGGDRVVSTGAYELSKLEPDVLKKTKLQIQLPKEDEEEEEEEK
jgi:multidrug efflux pump subunit AcrA (membrane-fusion protein)